MAWTSLLDLKKLMELNGSGLPLRWWVVSGSVRRETVSLGSVTWVYSKGFIDSFHHQ